MADKRPEIPAELRRRVLIEAGHRCAIPTCGYIEVDVHHIVPYEKCKKHEYENLIALCPNCHRRAGKGEIDRKSQRIYKANLRFAHDKFSQFEIDTIFTLAQLPTNNALPFPIYLSLLVKRSLDTQYVTIVENETGIFAGPIKTTPDFLMITSLGRQFINSLGLENNG